VATRLVVTGYQIAAEVLVTHMEFLGGNEHSQLLRVEGV
jgi:hypothetical protein